MKEKTSKSVTRSRDLFQQAKHYMPGGVNSPVRSFQSVGGVPPFIQSAKGAFITDVDGYQYIDYVGSWGSMILGHAHPRVVQAVKQALDNGLSYGAPCESEIQLAKMIIDCMPSIEKIRMVNSGTEATMSALRLARGVTGRSKIIKFEGCYHGHADSLLVQAGSGPLTLNISSSAGVTSAAIADTLLASFNDMDSVTRLFKQYPQDIAAVIVEPMAANMNFVPALPEFIKGLRKICDHSHSLLIFDEVITGFRVSRGGAQAIYDVYPDLTALGKIIGGGMPVGAYGGRADIMNELAPEGHVYQAGTLSGNPIAMAAGIATLDILNQPDFYEMLREKTERLVLGILSRAESAGIPLVANFSCGVLGLFFTECERVSRWMHVQQMNLEHFKQFFHGALNAGIYLAPSSFESVFVSAAHDHAIIDKTLDQFEKIFHECSFD